MRLKGTRWVNVCAAKKKKKIVTPLANRSASDAEGGGSGPTLDLLDSQYHAIVADLNIGCPVASCLWVADAYLFGFVAAGLSLSQLLEMRLRMKTRGSELGRPSPMHLGGNVGTDLCSLDPAWNLNHARALSSDNLTKDPDAYDESQNPHPYQLLCITSISQENPYTQSQG